MTRPAVTLWLSALVALLAVGDAWVHLGPTGPVAEEPTIARFDGDLVDRVELGTSDAQVVLERAEGDWRLLAPVEGDADDAAVERLLARLSGGLDLQRVDDGRHEAYGLSGGDERRVRLLAGDAALLSVLVGNNAADGDTFVRVDDDPVVYRTALGGRSAIVRPPSAWRAPEPAPELPEP